MGYFGRQDGDKGSGQLVLIKPDDLADIDRPPEIEGIAQEYPRLRRNIPQVGKYFRHEGRNIKRFREMLGIKQETLAPELG